MIPIDPLKILSFAARGAGKLIESTGKGGARVLAKGTDDIVSGKVKQNAGKIKDKAVKGFEKLKGVGKTVGDNILDEAEFVGNVGLHTKHALMGDAPFSSSVFGADSDYARFFKKTAIFKESSDSLLGVKFTGLGKGLAMGTASLIGTKKAAEEFSQSRIGANDGNMYTNTPTMQFGGQTFQSMGASYANNGGATGDLGFALHNQRHSGLF